jgi:dipeptide/tripeptide permease
MAYAAAPKNLKGFVTACFLLTITLANFINSWLCQLYGGSLTDPPENRGPLSPGAFFAMTALIVAAATIGFVIVGRRFDRSEFGEPPSASAR